MNAPAMKHPDQRNEDSDARESEPIRLVIGRSDDEIEGRAGFVPQAAIVGCLHPEGIVPRRQVAVESLPSSAGILPIAIIAFQLVLEMHLLRNNKARRRVVDLEITSKGGKTKTRARRICLSIRNHIFDMHRRRKGISELPFRINHLRHSVICEPKATIVCPCGNRAKRTEIRLGAVECVEKIEIYFLFGMFTPSLQIRRLDLNQATLGIQPKIR